MTTSIKPIETRYAGCRFRSRQEARWAVYFDALGWEWEYEPEGFELPPGWYLPDFRVHATPFGEDLPWQMRRRKDWTEWYEVKPSTWRASVAVGNTCREVRLAIALAVRTRQQVSIVGEIPRPRGYSYGYRVRGYDMSLEPKPFRLWGGDDAPEHDYYAGSDKKFKAAIAARSARFEHGESGTR